MMAAFDKVADGSSPAAADAPVDEAEEPEEPMAEPAAEPAEPSPTSSIGEGVFALETGVVVKRAIVRFLRTAWLR